jgi:hypothetical protein
MFFRPLLNLAAHRSALCLMYPASKWFDGFAWIAATHRSQPSPANATGAYAGISSVPTVFP